MNKPEVIAAVSEVTDLPKTQVEKVLDDFVKVIADSLASGQDVFYPNLGKFQVKEQAARVARNPHTGESIQVGAKKVVKFSISKSLKHVGA